jgi:hypothetical protein
MANCARFLLARCGGKAFMLYSLRLTFATRIAPHVDAWTLCKILGWASLSVAMTYVEPYEKKVLKFSVVMNLAMLPKAIPETANSVQAIDRQKFTW